MQANDLNDLGEVVGGTYDAGVNMHGFTWTKGGGLVDLGKFGGESGYVQSVNNAGISREGLRPMVRSSIQPGSRSEEASLFLVCLPICSTEHLSTMTR